MHTKHQKASSLVVRKESSRAGLTFNKQGNDEGCEENFMGCAMCLVKRSYVGLQVIGFAGG